MKQYEGSYGQMCDVSGCKLFATHRCTTRDNHTIFCCEVHAFNARVDNVFKDSIELPAYTKWKKQNAKKKIADNSGDEIVGFL